MLETDRNRQPGGLVLPRDWQTLKREAMDRAHVERALAMRAIVAWTVGRTAALVRRLVDRFVTWQVRREAIAQLSSLDNRSLRDIGINRSEIESAVRGWDPTRIRESAAYRKPRSAVRPKPVVTKRAA
jgi:uncharacterized protein YjiS (DUF1127 family)